MKRMMIGLSGLFAWFLCSNTVLAAPDFSQIKSTKERQRHFFNYLKPKIEKANEAILKQRIQVVDYYKQWQKKHELTAKQAKDLRQIAKKYKLNGLHFTNKGDWLLLQKRVDIVPVSMVMAQAANESAWGTSRFAKLGHNYFGQWCFTEGCGIVPTKRPAGKHYAVTRFNNAFESVASYMNNLNTNSHYQLFRQLRFEARNQQHALNGYQLAKGLLAYSERGQAYVNSIQSIISHHRLTQYDIA